MNIEKKIKNVLSMYTLVSHKIASFNHFNTAGGLFVCCLIGFIFIGNVFADGEKLAIPEFHLREKEFVIAHEYLVLPIDETEKKVPLSIYIDSEKLCDYEVALAAKAEDAQWYAFFSLKRFEGQKARVVTRTTNSGLDLIKQTDNIPQHESFYTEQLRPQFHFSSKRGWLNDVNGMIYYDGLYHMYYQHNPVSIEWGNMTWGHATSRDMVHWTEQPKVLFPHNEIGTCFSGAAFIDFMNQLGKKSGDQDVIVAAYLRTEIGLSLAYSNDCGQTFKDYEHNPVLNHPGERIDTPRPFFYRPTGRWVSPTYDWFINDKGQKRRCVGFYSSANLKDWKFESRVEQNGWGDELCGCVDFFQLPIDGNEANVKWVMIFIDGSYIVGDFDGSVFYTLEGKPAHTEDRETSLVIRGNYYATMTFENHPQGRRVQLTWMRGDIPGMPFNHQITLPSELTLHSTPDGPRLRMNPIKSLESLRKKTHQWRGDLKPDENPLSAIDGELFEVEAEFAPSTESETVFNLRGIQVIYDANTQMVTCKGSGKPLSAKLVPADGVIRLRIFLDRTALEVYGNDGVIYMPLVVFPDVNNTSLSAVCSRGQVKCYNLRVHELKSIWREG
ncbi:MAG: glycoside hydrolase family 32 protein [Phycisphaerae bacterium]|nr:glycoside hydrolase family 32 protein [Phycisphaerae bacterium]